MPQPAPGRRTAAPIAYPRPQITVLPAELFREPVYADGQPYVSEDHDEDPTDRTT